MLNELINSVFFKNTSKIYTEFSGERFTYNEIDILSRKYIKYLSSIGVNPLNHLLIETSRSPYLIALIIAIIRLGGSYSVVNPTFPKKRKDEIYRKTESAFWINLKEIDLKEVTVYEGDTFFEREEEALLYVIFTSGSTGTPKAIEIRDSNLLNFIADKRLAIDSNLVFSHMSSLDFDASVFELWCSFFNGCRVYIFKEEELLSLNTFVETLKKEVNILWLTTTFFNLLVEQFPKMFESIDTVFVGGEQMSVMHTNKALNYTNIYNCYGPTENTVFTTMMYMSEKVDNIYLGSPINNVELFIDGIPLERVENGFEGELGISGKSLSNGYINGSENSEQFYERDYKKIYKSGDWVRKIGEEIFFIGRKDSQVKINGYRIDIQEITAAVSELTKKDVYIEKDSSRLVVYMKVKNETIKKELSKIFPSYMIPSLYKYCKYFPITRNGKLNKEKLRENSKIVIQI